MSPIRVGVVLSAALLAACAPEREDSVPEAALVPEEWRLSTEPLLEIGVVEGEEAYQLHEASSSARLPDGRIAVLNSGTDEVRFFDARGVYLGSFGGEGEGPGEFRRPVHLKLLKPDSLRIWDQGLGRFSYFDTTGAFDRVERPEGVGVDPFALDVWLYGRSLVDSPVPPGTRGALQPGLDALPAVDTAADFRYVRLTEQGRFWVAASRPPVAAPIAWSVYSLDGTPVAGVETPARFEPHEIAPDYVLGRWRDEFDVNRIRLYALEKPTDSPSGPGLAGVRASGDAVSGALFPETGAFCVLSYGFVVPMGWSSGMVICP